MHELVEIALAADEAGDARLAPDRPVVLIEQHLRIASLLQHILQISRPLQGIAHLGATYGQQIVHGLSQNLGPSEGLALGDAESQLGRCFGPRHVVKHKAHAVQHHLLVGPVHAYRRRQNPRVAADQILAQAGVHIACGRQRQPRAELIDSTPCHGRAHEQVLAGGLTHEARRRHHGYFALRHFRRTDDSQGTAKMVCMAVREDQRRHRLVAQVLAGKCHGGRSHLAAGQRVHHNPASLSLDQGDIAHVKAAQLVDTVADLEQPGLGIEAGVAPKAGVDAVGRGALHKIKGRKILEHAPIGAPDLACGPGYQAPLRIFAILSLVRRQALCKSGQHLARGIADLAWLQRTSVLRNGRRCCAASQHASGKQCGSTGFGVSRNSIYVSFCYSGQRLMGLRQSSKRLQLHRGCCHILGSAMRPMHSLRNFNALNSSPWTYADCSIWSCWPTRPTTPVRPNSCI